MSPSTKWYSEDLKSFSGKKYPLYGVVLTISGTNIKDDAAVVVVVAVAVAIHHLGPADSRPTAEDDRGWPCAPVAPGHVPPIPRPAGGLRATRSRPRRWGGRGARGHCARSARSALFCRRCRRCRRRRRRRGRTGSIGLSGAVLEFNVLVVVCREAARAATARADPHGHVFGYRNNQFS